MTIGKEKVKKSAGIRGKCHYKNLLGILQVIDSPPGNYLLNLISRRRNPNFQKPLNVGRKYQNASMLRAKYITDQANSCISFGVSPSFPLCLLYGKNKDHLYIWCQEFYELEVPVFSSRKIRGTATQDWLVLRYKWEGVCVSLPFPFWEATFWG